MRTVHKSPIQYLEARVKYYNNLAKRMRSNLNDEFFIRKYGKEELEKLIARRLEEIEKITEEYEYGILILKRETEKMFAPNTEQL